MCSSDLLPVGSELRNESRSSQKSQYRIRLEEKQKLCFHYGLTERQLLKYVRIVGKTKGSTGQVLLQLLEMRLNNIPTNKTHIAKYKSVPKKKPYKSDIIIDLIEQKL